MATDFFDKHYPIYSGINIAFDDVELLDALVELENQYFFIQTLTKEEFQAKLIELIGGNASNYSETLEVHRCKLFHDLIDENVSSFYLRSSYNLFLAELENYQTELNQAESEDEDSDEDDEDDNEDAVEPQSKEQTSDKRFKQLNGNLEDSIFAVTALLKGLNDNLTVNHSENLAEILAIEKELREKSSQLEQIFVKIVRNLPLNGSTITR